MGEESITSVLVAIGKLEVQVLEARKDIHDIRNVMTQYVPRPELEKWHTAQNARIDKLEDDKTWLQRQIWGAWLAGLGVVVSMFLQKP